MTEACYQALLRHFWSAREGNYPPAAKIYPHGYLMTYGQLVDAAKVPIDPRRAGGPLFHVAARCVAAGKPPINALVVNKQTGIPGEGFFAAPGSKASPMEVVAGAAFWEPIAEQCIACDDYEKPTPRH